ncbi:MULTISPECIES: glycosyltransferase family 2 protein [unclassified Streptococcus]|uniref:glycosyltransferase family 2 protein n=1 Tax=unclassified Streptococcus TaxID=2608887 RepID=UPI00359ECCE6
MATNHTYVICAYGDSPYLLDCIRSLKAQTLQSEIILYTSTPSDYIYRICETEAIPVFTRQGGGIGKDWNNALSFVKTRYATIAHQDDVYLPEYGQKVLSQAREDSLILYSDYAELKDSVEIPANTNLHIKRLMLRCLAMFPQVKWWRYRILAFGNPICCPAVTYDLKNVTDFQFDEQLKVSLDWYAWYQISQRQGLFEYISEPLMFHRIHEESETTNNIENNNRTAEDYFMYKLFWPKWFAKLLLRYYVKSQETN